MNVVHRVLDPALGQQVPPGRCALAVMTKAPRAGRVKTRLTPPLTSEQAAALNVCFLRDTTAAITVASEDDRAQGIGVYTPVGEESAYAEILPAHFELIPQRGDAFGERLIYATQDLLRVGFASVCLIDSDSPTVPPTAYARAVQILAQPGESIVLGPSDDGGYYLIGLKQLHRRLFEDIAWSTERVCQQTIERAHEIGLAVEFLPTWYDVDDHATLRRLCNELLNENTAPDGYAAPETRGFMTDLIAREGRAQIWPNE